LEDINFQCEMVNTDEYEKRIIFYYIEDQKNIINFLKTFANLNDKKSKFTIYIPEFDEIFNVNKFFTLSFKLT